MKKYVLIISKNFPSYHLKKGKETEFINKILNKEKVHTIRNSFPLWAKRIKEVQEGKAVLSLRYWAKEGGRSVKGNKQVEFARLDKDSGIGIQKVEFSIKNEEFYFKIKNIDGEIEAKNKCRIGSSWIDFVYPNIDEVAKNDGLTLKDFKDWFKNYDLSKTLAVIHFTEFRY